MRSVFAEELRSGAATVRFREILGAANQKVLSAGMVSLAMRGLVTEHGGRVYACIVQVVYLSTDASEPTFTRNLNMVAVRYALNGEISWGVAPTLDEADELARSGLGQALQQSAKKMGELGGFL